MSFNRYQAVALDILGQNQKIIFASALIGRDRFVSPSAYRFDDGNKKDRRLRETIGAAKSMSDIGHS